MSPAIDVDSLLAAVPASIPDFGAGLHGLSGASATPSAFLAEGRHVVVSGPGAGEPASAVRVSIGGRALLRTLDPGSGSVANLLLFPGLVRRELVGARGTLTETLLAVPMLPLFVGQWRTAPSGGIDGVRMALDPGLSEVATELGRSGRAVILALPDDRVVLIASSSGMLRVDLPSSEIAIAPATDGSGCIDLLVVCAAPGSVRTALAAAAHAAAHAVQAARGPIRDGLRLLTGVDEIDEGVAWARARIPGLVRRLAEDDCRDAATGCSLLLTGLAAVAVGDTETAEHAGAAIGSRSDEGALLAGRLAMTVGRTGPAVEAAQALLERGRSSPPPRDEAMLRGLAARTLADGLRFAAPEKLIEELRRAGPAPDTAPAPAGLSGGGRRLPMAGEAPSEAAWLAGVLRGDPPSVPAPGTAATDDALRRACAGFRSGPDAAWQLWRNALALGLRSGPAGPGTWEPNDTSGTATTAELLLALGHGLLGISPDAPVGRVRVAPRLPSHLLMFRAEGISVGDSHLSLDYERTGSGYRFSVIPEGGAVPPLLLFEPTVAGRVTEVRIDGVLADLEPRADGSHTVVPVQIPVDAIHVVEIDTEG